MHLLHLYILTSVAAASSLTEEERVKQWRRKHTWPPLWQLETPEYKERMQYIENEIMQLEGMQIFDTFSITALIWVRF